MTYNLSLTQGEAHLIMQALGELPLKVALNTFANVQRQIAEQDESSAIELNEAV